MDYMLISNYDDITYAGEVVAGSIKEQYIVVKPNKRLDFSVAFKTATIKKIIHLDGKAEDFERGDVKVTEAKIQDDILVRMQGGVSFRGNRCELEITDWNYEKGFWLAPMEDENMVFWIPEEEILKQFQK